VKSSLTIAALVGVAVAVVACSDRAPTRDAIAIARDGPRTERRADAIQGGAKDTTSTFAVAVLDGQNGVCSGTLIAPNLVLTARHCVATDTGGATVDCTKDHFNPAADPSTLRVSTDADAAFDTAAFQASKIFVPADTAFCGNDLALIVLSKLVPASVAKPATPAVDPPLTDRAAYGTKLTAIGYGISAPGANDDGVRRKRSGIAINCIPGDATIGCDPADFGMTTSELAAGNGLCDGDSGSGAYEPKSLAAGAPIVMGVLSRAADVSGQCADAVYGRTDSAAALLVNAAKAAAAAGGYATPAWADPTAAQSPDAGTSDGGEPSIVDPSSDVDAGAPGTTSPSTTTSGCAVTQATGDSRARTDASLGASALLAAAVFAIRRRPRSQRRKPL
jgi:hypothetical protein